MSILHSAPRLLPLGALAVASSLAWAATQADEPQLRDRYLDRVGDALAEWYAANEAGTEIAEAEREILEQMERAGKRLDDSNDLLSSPADVGRALWLANQYEKKVPRRGQGKVSDQTYEFRDQELEYAVWLPSKYRVSQGPYSLLLTVPEEGVDPKTHITEKWISGDLRDNYVIASPKMPGNGNEWTEMPGITAVMITLRAVTETYAVDFDRIYIGGRGRGAEAATAIANMFPDRFAGAFGWAGDIGDSPNPANFSNLPTYFAGGGSKVTKFSEGLENCEVDPDGKEADILAWMAATVRAKYPEHVVIVPGERFPTGAYWLEIPALAGESSVRIEGTVDRETNTITLTGDGVTEATIHLSDGLVDLDRPVTVVANGVTHKDSFERSFRTTLSLISQGKSDPGRVFVASKSYDLPAVGGGSEGGEGK